MTTIPTRTETRTFPRRPRPASTEAARFRAGQILQRGGPLSESDAAELHGVYAGQLTGFARRIGAKDAESVANQALFDTFRAYDRNPIVDEPAFRGYAYRATKSHTINEARRRQPEPVAPEEIVLLSGCPSIEAESQAVIDRLWLTELLDQLTDDQAEVLRLRLIDGLTAEEVGRRLDRAPNAVYQLQHRAQQRLRRLALAAALAAVLVAAAAAVIRSQSDRIVIEPSPADRTTTTTPGPAQPNGDAGSTVSVDVGPDGGQTDAGAFDVGKVATPGDQETTDTTEATRSTDQPGTSTSVDAEPAPPVSIVTTATTLDAGAGPGNPPATPIAEVAERGTRPNMCRVVDNGRTVLLELFDLSLSDISGDEFVEPASYVMVATNPETGNRYEIRSEERQEPVSWFGWTEGSKPFLAAPGSGESRWAIYVGVTGTTLSEVGYVLADGEAAIDPCGRLAP